MPRFAVIPLFASLLLALLSTPIRAAGETVAQSVDALTADPAAVLDAFHAAASRADENTYIGLLWPLAVFLGTDGTERWDKTSFRAFVHPYFAAGKGWTYTPSDRHILFSHDHTVAWFDERLDNDSYGECRGTGVLVKTEGGWRIAQYNLSIPMPNDLAKDLTARIRAARPAKPASPGR